MDAIINRELISNPMNWLIVLLMVVIGNLALSFVIAAAKNAD